MKKLMVIAAMFTGASLSYAQEIRPPVEFQKNDNRKADKVMVSDPDRPGAMPHEVPAAPKYVEVGKISMGQSYRFAVSINNEAAAIITCSVASDANVASKGIAGETGYWNGMAIKIQSPGATPTQKSILETAQIMADEGKARAEGDLWQSKMGNGIRLRYPFTLKGEKYRIDALTVEDWNGLGGNQSVYTPKFKIYINKQA